MVYEHCKSWPLRTFDFNKSHHAHWVIRVTVVFMIFLRSLFGGAWRLWEKPLARSYCSFPAANSFRLSSSVSFTHSISCLLKMPKSMLCKSLVIITVLSLPFLSLWLWTYRAMALYHTRNIYIAVLSQIHQKVVLVKESSAKRSFIATVEPPKNGPSEKRTTLQRTHSVLQIDCNTLTTSENRRPLDPDSGEDSNSQRHFSIQNCLLISVRKPHP